MAVDPQWDGLGQPASERQIEYQVRLGGTLLWLAFVVVVVIVNVLTQLTDAARLGTPLDPREPWITEITSGLLTACLIPFVALVERRYPFSPEGWRRALLVHLGGSIAFSALHVGGMVALRMILFALIMGQTYAFFADPWTDLLYEYRKDILTYGMAVVLLGQVRMVLEARREVDIARSEARRSGRLTLRSGGRVMMLDAHGFQWAEAAGNYVEVRAAGRIMLARATLKQLEQQLADAGIAVTRIHRSRIVNGARVTEIVADDDGDFQVRIDDGATIRGSRRFRRSAELAVTET
jgi:hypothetical protein